MSSKNFSFNTINNNLSNLKENFINSKEQEASPINPTEYIISIEGARTNMVNWLSFLCTKLNFADQTLFRSISIFDQYISRITPEEAINLTQETLNLITIFLLKRILVNMLKNGWKKIRKEKQEQKLQLDKLKVAL